MAIADTITSMQTHTSNAYTMIGYGTDLTGINKNLENLSSTIFEAFLEALRTPDTLFTNLPKKSGTGANITLNDTANAPMRIELGASELSQDGTPTPSSPQEIHTISGSNKVVVSNSDNTISQEADIDLGNIEYCKIGNYEDKIFKNIPAFSEYDSNLIDGAWYIKKNIGKTTINSSNVDDLVQDFATSYGHNRIMFTKSKLGWQTSWTQNICLMNKYKEINSTSSTATGTFTLNFNQTYIMVFNDNFTDLATAKTELLGTEIYIAQATPTYTQITGTLAEQLENIYQKLLSYSGTTNISQINNDLSFVLSVQAIEE